MRVRVAHISLQFTDPDRQHTRDIEKIFDRAATRRQAWITGTEAGPLAGNTGEELIRIGKKYGYLLYVPEVEGKEGTAARRVDCWVAVRKDLVKKGTFKQRFVPVIPASDQLEKQHPELPNKSFGPRGVVYVEFDSTNRDLGHVTVMAAHYLTEARRPSSPWWKWNEKLAKAIGDLAKEKGKGTNLVFYGGDQNMVDKNNNEPQGDTFLGQPLTSTWDELRHWENTGRGNIDVIATYDADKRVKAINTVSLEDKQFFLHTDHFYVEAEIRVAPLKR